MGGFTSDLETPEKKTLPAFFGTASRSTKRPAFFGTPEKKHYLHFPEQPVGGEGEGEVVVTLVVVVVVVVIIVTVTCSSHRAVGPRVSSA